ncbi:uncharacterized protein TNCV_4373911 [Trichonephila clavipes]|uniref:Uncharacterized protein n=1 Tax=Trichonephila clavipes TaxID=2585209 RepID=A0A8X6R3V2_TRICX|nr:uncharacterized protein TNCV_4373911 [Trichonephila clavipes]
MGNTTGFMYLKQKFPKIREAKFEEGIFVGPQIRSLMHDEKLEELLNPLDNAAWQAFKNVTHSFLGNLKAEIYRDIVHGLITSYKNLGCNMSLKIHFLHSHLDFFPENLGAVSDEHGNAFLRGFQRKKRDIEGNGMLICWLIIAGPSRGILHRRNIKGNRDFLMFR